MHAHVQCALYKKTTNQNLYLYLYIGRDRTMEVQREKAKSYAFDGIFFKRFRKCLGVIFPNFFCDSTLLLSILLGLAVSQQLVIFNVGILPSKFMEVLGNKSETEMKSLVVKALILIIGIAVFNSASKAVSGFLYIHWRNMLTNFLQQNYMKESMHYFITNGLTVTKLDNVDQRITQEVDKLCLSSSEIIAKLLISPLVIIYYSIKCFKVTGVTGPFIIYGYFLIGAFVNKILMSFIVNLIYKKEMKEGDFRFKHMRIRTASESIALVGAEAYEGFKLNQCFKELLFTQRKIVNMEILLNFSTNFIDYLGSVISYMIISVPIFGGKYNDLTPVEMSAVISKNAFVSMYLINCFSTLVDLSTELTEISGYCHRIGELVETIRTQEKIQKKKKIHFLNNQNEEDCNGLFKITNLTYTRAKSNKKLLIGLDLEVFSKQNLIVLGETGMGKSSLFRVIRELWEPTTGHVQFHKNLMKKEIMFLPQIPVLACGSLLELVIYPNLKKDIGNYSLVTVQVKEALNDVGLLHLVEYAGGDIDCDQGWVWEQKLSPGQIQKIQFARLFYHKPCLAFLDEATSSLGLTEEGCLYQRCESLGIAVVSIGHRDSLMQYHKNFLKIKDNGLWEYGKI